MQPGFVLSELHLVLIFNLKFHQKNPKVTVYGFK